MTSYSFQLIRDVGFNEETWGLLTLGEAKVRCRYGVRVKGDHEVFELRLRSVCTVCVSAIEAHSEVVFSKGTRFVRSTYTCVNPDCDLVKVEETLPSDLVQVFGVFSDPLILSSAMGFGLLKFELDFSEEEWVLGSWPDCIEEEKLNLVKWFEQVFDFWGVNPYVSLLASTEAAEFFYGAAEDYMDSVCN